VQLASRHAGDVTRRDRVRPADWRHNQLERSNSRYRRPVRSVRESARGWYTAWRCTRTRTLSRYTQARSARTTGFTPLSSKSWTWRTECSLPSGMREDADRVGARARGRQLRTLWWQGRM